MIVGICGLLGSGKTLLMTILGYMAHKNGKKVYSNYYTTYSEMINPLDLLNFELNNCVILLDEIETICDSRISGSEINRVFTYFYLQTRKRNVDIYYTSQLLGAVDLRLRFITDYVVYAEKTTNGFNYTVFLDDIPFSSFRLNLENAQKFFNMYDTNQIIHPFFVLSRINFEKVLEVYRKAPSRKAFIQTLRKIYPHLKEADCYAAFDYIRNGDYENAKLVLGVKKDAMQKEKKEEEIIPY